MLRLEAGHPVFVTSLLFPDFACHAVAQRRREIRISPQLPFTLLSGALLAGFHSPRNAVYISANSAPVAQPDRATDF
jgi:hypothetical protein